MKSKQAESQQKNPKAPKANNKSQNKPALRLKKIAEENLLILVLGHN